MQIPTKPILVAAMAAMLTTGSALAAQETAPAEPQEETLDLNHIGLAVSDLEASTAFFIETLGFKPAGGNPDYPANFVFNGGIFVTLWQVTDPEAAIPFDRKNNVGLHHMAINVRDLATLHDLHRRFLEHPHVTVEFGPEFLGNGPTTHMMIRDPSGLRLEFIVSRGRMSAEEQALPNPRTRD